MIQFQAKYLKMLFSFMAKQDIRYYLNGIYIEPHKDGGAVLVATDGHAMLCIRDTSAKCEDAKIISISRDAIKFSGKPSAMCYVDMDAKRLKVADNCRELYIQPNDCFIEGKFPEFKRVMPDFRKLKDVLPNAIDLRILQKLSAVQTSGACRSNSPIRLWSIGADFAPVVVQFADIPEAFAIIMPIRSDCLNHAKLIELGNRFVKWLP